MNLIVEGLEAEILRILITAFPRAFFPSGRNCRPLRVGIFEDLHAMLPPEIDRTRLKLYLGHYTGQPSYLHELKPGAIRIGLDGRAAGRVSLKDAASAAARLQKLLGPENGSPIANASASNPASAPRLTPTPLTGTPRTVNPQRTPVHAVLAETLLKEKSVRSRPQRVIVVVKRRKIPGRQPIAAAAIAANGGNQ
jgi:sRNA-binding protein